MRSTAEHEADERDTATARLLKAYREQGDERARDRLVELYLPLVAKLARRHRGPRAEYDDLLQAGSIGLLNAIERYDAGRGTRFTAYAVPTVSGEMKRFIRDRGATVRLPRPLAEAAGRLPATREALSRKLSRTPSSDELAEALGITAAELASLEPALPDGGALRQASAGQDGFGDEGLVIRDALDSLEPREREIVMLRFVEEAEQGEVARRLGISEVELRRRTRAALAKLRHELEEVGELEAPKAAPAQPVPDQPKPEPARSVHSGRLLLRMPPSLHDELAAAAAHEGVSLNRLITDTLTAAVASGGAQQSDPAPDMEVREVPRWLPGAIVANIVIVVLAAVVALVLLMLAWQNGW